MDTLNIIFGIITVLSFVFGIFTYYKMKKSESLKNKCVREIKRLANRIKYGCTDEVYEGLADGIISSCNTLLHESISNNSSMTFKLSPCDKKFSRLESKIGKIVDDEKSVTGRALYAISKRNPNVKYNHLVYGPYKRLHSPGMYEVKYRIKLINLPDSYKKNKDIIRLDVYDYQGGKIVLAKRNLKYSSFKLSDDFNEFSIKFDYSDLSQILEFRIEFLELDVEASTDLIVLSKL